jgi:hypothetical protein
VRAGRLSTALLQELFPFPAATTPPPARTDADAGGADARGADARGADAGGADATATQAAAMARNAQASSTAADTVLSPSTGWTHAALALLCGADEFCGAARAALVTNGWQDEAIVTF